MANKKAVCHVCNGIDSEDCQECDGMGSYDFYKYNDSFDDCPERNEIEVEELDQTQK